MKTPQRPRLTFDLRKPIGPQVLQQYFRVLHEMNGGDPIPDRLHPYNWPDPIREIAERVRGEPLPSDPDATVPCEPFDAVLLSVREVLSDIANLGLQKSLRGLRAGASSHAGVEIAWKSVNRMIDGSRGATLRVRGGTIRTAGRLGSLVVGVVESLKASGFKTGEAYIAASEILAYFAPELFPKAPTREWVGRTYRKHQRPTIT